jgi:hypothetical protein
MSRVFVPVLVFACLLGCGSEPQEEAAAPPAETTPAAGTTGGEPAMGHGPGPHAGMGHGPGMHGAMTAEMCPMGVAGTTATAEETENGVAMRFQTTGDVDAVRQRARAMAEHHAAMGKDGGMPHPMPMAGVPATVEDVEGGARIVFTPTADQKPQVQQHVKDMASAMATSGQCPMMAAAAGGAPQ